MYGDFGPKWFWNLVFALAVIGFVYGVISLVDGVIWLINHLRFK